MVDFVHVAVGVILDSQKRVLLALRPDHLHQGGLWEFPGGKVEAGESVQQALSRELSEELGLKPIVYRPLLELRHDYVDKSVLLDVWWVDKYEGQALGLEGQSIEWVSTNRLTQYDFPEANTAIVEAVQREMLE